MSFTRTTSGRLAWYNASDASHPFVSADFTISGSASKSVSSGRLRIARVSSNYAFCKIAAVTSRATSLVVVAFNGDGLTGGKRVGIAAQISDITSGSLDGVSLTAPMNFTSSGGLLAMEHTNDALSTLFDTGGGTRNYSNTGEHALALFVDGQATVGYEFDFAATLSGTASSHTSGQLGVVFQSGTASAAIDFTALVASTGRYLTVTGAEDVYTLEVAKADGTTLAAARSTGGVALIDMIGVKPWEAVRLVARNAAGTEVDSLTLMDDILVGGDTYALSGITPPAYDYPLTLAIINPGAEKGSTVGWTNVTGTLGLRTTANSPLPHSGSYYFYGGPGTSFEGYQDITIPSATYADVDAGFVEVTLAAWQAGFEVGGSDVGQLAVRFLDASGAQVGSGVAGDVVSENPTWTQHTVQTTVPASARVIRIRLIGSGNTSNVDSYFDDLTLSLSLTESPPSAPGAFIVPATPTTADTSQALQWGAATDPDGDPLQYEIRRTVDGGPEGVVISLQTGLTATDSTLGSVPAGSEVVYYAYAYDGTTYGPSVASATVTIGNHPPSAPTVTITGTTSSSVTFTWTFSDPDADTHDGSDWKITSDAAGNAIVTSGSTSGTTSTATATVAFGTALYLWVRVYDEFGAVSGWGLAAVNPFVAPTPTVHAALELWSGYECQATADRLAIITGLVGTCQIRVGTDRKQDRLVFAVSRTLEDGSLNPVVSLAQTGQIVRSVDYAGTVREWRIRYITDGVGPKKGTVSFQCLSPAVDLHSAGPIEYQGSTSMGLVAAEPSAYLSTFLIPYLTDKGITYVSLGTVDSTASLTINFSDWTGAQLLEKLENETGLEFTLRRNGITDYQIDLVTQIGAGANEALLEEGRNVITLERTRRDGDYFNTVRPKGGVPAGGSDPAGIKYNVWTVGDVVGSVVTLADIGGGDAPIAFDDQLGGDPAGNIPGRYLEKTDGTLTEITDSDADADTVTVADATGISIGDRVAIIADSSGSGLTELANPAEVAVKGRVLGTVTDTTMRGERNYLLNSAFGTWTPTLGEALAATLVAASSGTGSMALSGLPASQAISAGDVVTNGGYYVEVTTGGTADGSGNLTVTVASGLDFSFGSDVAVAVLRSGALPDGWAMKAASVSSAGGSQPWRLRDRSLTGSGSGTIASHTAGSLALGVTGFPADFVVQAGDRVTFGGNGYVAQGKVTLSGGAGTIVLDAGGFSDIAGTAVTVTRPTLPSSDGIATGRGLTLLSRTTYDGLDPTNAAVWTPPVTVRAESAPVSMWAQAAYTITNAYTSALALSSTTLAPPRLAIVDADTSTLLASTWDADRIVRAGESVSVTLQLPYTYTTTTNLAVAVQGCQYVSGSSTVGTSKLPTVLRWVMLSIGPEAPPYIDGSWATALWQLGNRRLVDGSAEQSSFVLQIRDLANAAEYYGVRADELLTLGADVRVKSTTLGVDLVLRNVGMEIDLVNPENTKIYIARRKPSFTRSVLSVAG